MGNVISRIHESLEFIYDKFYPKSRYLQPVYASSFLMASELAFIAATTSVAQKSRLTNFAFLFGAAGSVGLQIWMTFVAGVTMIKLLPRHQLGLVQSNLFPKYFFLNTLFSFGSLAAFLRMNPFAEWQNETKTLGLLLAGSFVVNTVNFTCFGVHTVKQNQKMHAIEKKAGCGSTTVGKLLQENTLENDQEYVHARKKFYSFHALSSVANVLTLASSVAQIYLLSNKSLF